MHWIKITEKNFSGGYKSFLYMIVASVLLVSCQNSSTSALEEEQLVQEQVSQLELEAALEEMYEMMDPTGSIPRPGEAVDLSKFKVEKDLGVMAKISTTGYQVDSLGSLGGQYPYGIGRGINNSGEATGYSYTSNNYHAFYYDGNSMTDLGTLNNNVYNSYSYGIDINNHGQIAGYSYASGSYQQAFFWDPQNGMIALGVLPGQRYSYATGINDNGQVVGHSSGSGSARGFIWDEENGMQEIGVPQGARYFYPEAINNHGVVVGRAYFNNIGTKAFTWSEADGFTDLGSLNQTLTSSYYYIYPRDINDSGQIIGDANNLSGHSNGAFFWDPTTGFHSLDTDNDNNTWYYAMALNNNGQVTGYHYDYSNNNYYYYNYSAFIWDASGDFIDLGHYSENTNNSYYYSYSIGYDINDNGAVVGYSYNNNGYNIPVIWEGGTSNEAPVADAGADQSVTATGATTSVTLDGSGSSDADGDALSYSWTLDGSVVSTDASFSTNLADGSYTFTLTVSDGEESDSDEVSVTVVNTIPVADAGADQTLEATGATTTVTLNGSATDADGDALTYSWSNGATGASTSVDLAVGTHTFTMTVTDEQGATDSDQVTVTITDTTAPVISFNQETNSLWPPNHKMVLVATGITASDIVDGTTDVQVEVSSSEAANGKGDGNTDSDYEIRVNFDGSIDVYVRAERSGKGKTGRTYTITMTTGDVAGNSSVNSFEVSVAKSQGRTK